MAKILDGKKVANELLASLKVKIENYALSSTDVTLAVVLVGNSQASLSYIKQKQKSAEEVGLNFKLIHFEDSVSQQELINKVTELNNDMQVHGIIVQLPLPAHIDTPLVLKAVSPRKDVDGFQAYNLGKMFLSSDFETLVPCTPKGIIKLLDYYKIPIKGKDITVVGHSNIVGKPMAIMFLNRDATVTVCHKETQDLKKHTLNADILVVAVGLPGLISADMVKKNAVVIDVGCTKVDEKLCGDVDFAETSSIAEYITPVPGGVGPMTVACLIENTILAYEWLKDHNFDIN